MLPTSSPRDEEDDRHRAAVEAAVEGAMLHLSQRLTEAAIARMQGPKARKGTPYWDPPGTKALDAGAVVDPGQWAEAATSAGMLLLGPAALNAAAVQRARLAGDGVTAPPPSPASIPADDDVQPNTGDERLDGIVTAAVEMLADWARERGTEQRDIVAHAAAAEEVKRRAVVSAYNAAVSSGVPIVTALRQHAQDAGDWARSVALSSATTALEGARQTVLEAAGDRVQRVWRTRRDDKVRVEHAEADGQTVSGTDQFKVGGFRARFPGDPLLPPHLRINCRCRIRYKMQNAQGRWVYAGKGVDDDVDTKDWDPALHPHGEHGHWATVAKHGLTPATDRDRVRLKKAGLVVPPAWQHVHVNPDRRAPLQVIGVDGKGRTCRLYSAAFTRRQAAAKFARIKRLDRRLPAFDRRIKRDAAANDAAAALMMIRRLGLRPGSDRDTGAETQAFGATNLRVKHVSVDGDTVRLVFTGKHAVGQDMTVEDPALAAALRPRLAGRDGEERLFSADETQTRAYFHTLLPEFKVKDLRTHRGTSLAVAKVAEMPVPTSDAALKRARREVAVYVSAALGNTPAVALESYIAPFVFQAWDPGANRVDSKDAGAFGGRGSAGDDGPAGDDVGRAGGAGGADARPGAGGPGRRVAPDVVAAVLGKALDSRGHHFDPAKHPHGEHGHFSRVARDAAEFTRLAHERDVSVEEQRHGLRRVRRGYDDQGSRLVHPDTGAALPLAADLRRAYAGDFVGGALHVDDVSAHVGRAPGDGSVDVPVLSVAGKVRAVGGEFDGEEVGHFERTFIPSEGVVKHDGLHLINGVQGRGFATEFLARSLPVYKEAGYRRAVVSAGDSAGGIVWAKAGFGWLDGRMDPVQERWLHRFADGGGWPGIRDAYSPPIADADGKGAAAAKALLDRLDAGDVPTPADLLTIDSGERDSLGRTMGEAMMAAEGWVGEKRLDEIKALLGAAMFTVTIEGLRHRRQQAEEATSAAPVDQLLPHEARLRDIVKAAHDPDTVLLRQPVDGSGGPPSGPGTIMYHGDYYLPVPRARYEAAIAKGPLPDRITVVTAEESRTMAEDARQEAAAALPRSVNEIAAVLSR